MNKGVRFWLLICLVAILMVILSIFVIYKYQIHKANQEADEIVIGDNENLEETDMENIENTILNDNSPEFSYIIESFLYTLNRSRD